MLHRNNTFCVRKNVAAAISYKDGWLLPDPIERESRGGQHKLELVRHRVRDRWPDQIEIVEIARPVLNERRCASRRPMFGDILEQLDRQESLFGKFEASPGRTRRDRLFPRYREQVWREGVGVVNGKRRHVKHRIVA